MLILLKGINKILSIASAALNEAGRLLSQAVALSIFDAHKWEEKLIRIETSMYGNLIT